MFFKKMKDMIGEREIDQEKKGMVLEKSDFLAIVIAAFTTLMPIVLLIFACLAALIFIIFR